MPKVEVPKSLKKWFIMHFIIDILFAVPLMFFPVEFLSFFGWNIIDPFSTRLVGAALFAIGTVSLLKRNAEVESYKSLLTLKILWSFAALVGILLSMIQGAHKFGWLIFGIFSMFFILWNYYLTKLKS